MKLSPQSTLELFRVYFDFRAQRDDNAHSVGTAIVFSFDERAILAQCRLKLFQHSLISWRPDNIDQ